MRHSTGCSGNCSKAAHQLSPTVDRWNRIKSPASTDVAAKYEEKGGDLGVALTTEELTKPVTVYQFTDKGVSLSAVATGTRYFLDDDLN